MTRAARRRTTLPAAVLAVALTAVMLPLGLSASPAQASSAATTCRATGTPQRLSDVLAKKPSRERRTAVAARLGTDGPGLRLRAQDRSLHLDSCDRPLYLEPRAARPGHTTENTPGAVPHGAAPEAGAAAHTPAQADPAQAGVRTEWHPEILPDGFDPFDLSSRPGSNRTIYLDFTGHTVVNTGWNDGFTGGSAFTVPAFSLDADRTTLTEAEREAIYVAWRHVAERYAPFDVNVTTADPGQAAITRSGPADDQYGTRALFAPQDGPVGDACGCAGVAYVDTFGESDADYYQPALTFYLPVDDGTTLASVAAHEVGHNVGLFHDGIGTADYWEGDRPQGPIMGTPYYRILQQWSNGDYPGATNTGQDDVALIAAKAPLLADDHADTIGSATPLPLDTPTPGLISSRADADVFAVDVPAGAEFEVSASTAGFASLNIGLTVYDEVGATVVSSPQETAVDRVGLADEQLTHLASGAPGGPAVRYYVAVDGVGGLAESGGSYSDYGSLGTFELGVGVPHPQPPAGPGPEVAVGDTVTLAEDVAVPDQARSFAVADRTADAPGPFAWTVEGLPPGLGVEVDTVTVEGQVSDHLLLTGAPTAPGFFVVRLTVTDGQGDPGLAMGTIEVTPAPPPPGPSVTTTDRTLRYSAQVDVVAAEAERTAEAPGPFTWSVLGSLPPGTSYAVSVSGSTERLRIVGTPNATGTYPFTVRAADADGHQSSGVVTMSVTLAGTPPTFSVAPPPTLTRHSATSWLGATAARTETAPGPFTWQATGLPSGLGLAVTAVTTPSGVQERVIVRGTPSAFGNFTVDWIVTDREGDSITQRQKLVVSKPLTWVTPATLKALTKGVATKRDLQVSGGRAPISWTKVKGTLPKGMQLTSSSLRSIRLKGTPKARGTFRFTMRAVDVDRRVLKRVFTITVR